MFAHHRRREIDKGGEAPALVEAAMDIAPYLVAVGLAQIAREQPHEQIAEAAHGYAFRPFGSTRRFTAAVTSPCRRSASARSTARPSGVIA